VPVKATHAKPVEEAGEISAITYGFMASKALFAAVEFDLFTHIARGADGMSALVQATGIAENRLVTFLAALKSLGLITEHDGRFVNAPATARYLVVGAPGDFRDYVRFVNGAFGYAANGYFPIRASMRASFMVQESAESSSAQLNTLGPSARHA